MGLAEMCKVVIGLESVKYSGESLFEASEELVKNLREDTHHLLYLHDVYRNKLILKGMLEKVYELCSNLCRGDEIIDALQPDTYKDNIRKARLNLLNTQQH